MRTSTFILKQVKKMLKKREVDIESIDDSDTVRPTAIIIASELGHVDMVRTLMMAKPKHADVNAETRLGRRAIWWVTWVFKQKCWQTYLFFYST